MKKPKLLEQVRVAARLTHYSIRTEEAYVAWTRRFIRFHGMRHPREMGIPEILSGGGGAGRGVHAEPGALLAPEKPMRWPPAIQ